MLAFFSHSLQYSSHLTMSPAVRRPFSCRVWISCGSNDCLISTSITYDIKVLIFYSHFSEISPEISHLIVSTKTDTLHETLDPWAKRLLGWS